MSTVIHRMVEQCRAGRHAPLVGRLASGWLAMGQQQVLPGYCLLLPDPVVPDLNALRGDARSRFLADMALAGDALQAVSGATRINYAIFGNVEPALHAHLFPRLATEAEVLRTVQPFAMDWQAAPRFSETLHGDLRRRLAAALERLAR